MDAASEATNWLSVRPSLVDGPAEKARETRLIVPGQLRASIIAEADLDERIARAQILRRVSLSGLPDDGLKTV